MDQTETPLYRLLIQILRDNGGFLGPNHLSELAELDRLRQVLIRCGASRFSCAAQDAKHLIGIITDSKRDYVRDVSLLASDPCYRGQYHAHTFDGSYQPARIPTPPKQENRPEGRQALRTFPGRRASV